MNGDLTPTQSGPGNASEAWRTFANHLGRLTAMDSTISIVVRKLQERFIERRGLRRTSGWP
jgi:hypothetical protein